MLYDLATRESRRYRKLQDEDSHRCCSRFFFQRCCLHHQRWLAILRLSQPAAHRTPRGVALGERRLPWRQRLVNWLHRRRNCRSARQRHLEETAQQNKPAAQDLGHQRTSAKYPPPRAAAAHTHTGTDIHTTLRTPGLTHDHNRRRTETTDPKTSSLNAPRRGVGARLAGRRTHPPHVGRGPIPSGRRLVESPSQSQVATRPHPTSAARNAHEAEGLVLKGDTISDDAPILMRGTMARGIKQRPHSSGP